MNPLYKKSQRKNLILLLSIGLSFVIFSGPNYASEKSTDADPFEPAAGKALTSTHIIDEGSINLDGKLDEIIWKDSHILPILSSTPQMREHLQQRGQR